MSSNYGQHISPDSSEESLLGNSEINDLDFVLRLIIENVLGLYISVADVSIVQVLDGLQNLVDNIFELLFGLDLQAIKTWEG